MVLRKVILIVLAAVILPLDAPRAQASLRAAPDNFVELVETVMPAVVNISTAQSAAAREAALQLGLTRSEGVSLGSGFIIDPSGIVVTNNHVIKGAAVITVTLENGAEYKAVPRGVDLETDLAVLQIEGGARFPYVEFGDSSAMKVGEWVVAIGQPFGLGGSVSAGIISGKSRNLDSGLYDDFLQTDAAINQGNSGGPLFNLRGEVVGVNTSIISQSGGSNGVGLAIPGRLAEKVVGQLITYGETFRGYLGVYLEDVTPSAQKRLSLPGAEGALVAGVPTAGGPAALAGIQVDDVIVRFDSQSVKTRRDLTQFVAEAQIGEAVPIEVIRRGQRLRLKVTIGRRETLTVRRNADTIELAGLTLQAANTETKTLYGLDPSIEGAVITNVSQTSPFADIFRAGDVIREFGWQKVSDPLSFDALLETARRDRARRPVSVLIQRGNDYFETLVMPQN
ncbi:possible serine protease [Parvularcula bermudensis HTCC2503]|uniref:Probable periplasmic serine endoprotease DegP-like n=1 Tax=Parvularcula bermudensis (strain ATCC BAA-594 / HTCC2503 / KCTC 12087) TaxID=314260 RepID=E0TCS6_PARBH|nr:trypsin-like peptidase domain-containing protein [Parvularcula bermudensis]ADM09865.1 possible serine protease [Parvularcula bermudensis HTCC2503]